MALELPHQFDSSETISLIVRGVVAMIAVAAAGALYSFSVSGDFLAPAIMLVATAMLIYVGRLIVRTLPASTGTIDAGSVVARPVHAWGVRLAGPEGTFAIRRYRAVRVEEVSAPIDSWGQRHERVSLIGRDGTPDILVARTELGADVGPRARRGPASACRKRLAAVSAISFRRTTRRSTW